MKKITLIGLGLHDPEDLTLKGLRKAKEADLVYLENYTSHLPGATKEKYEEKIGKRIQYADRDFVEKGNIFMYAESNTIALLVPGDPMVATTHADLIIRARERNIKTEIIHNASIYSAIGETGLQIYKFGKTTTMPFWKGEYKPTSFYDVIKNNKERGLHTLVLLDIEKEKGRYLTADKALQRIIEMKKQACNEETEVAIVAQLGSPKQEIKYGKIKELVNQPLPPAPHTIIVPGTLHKKEEEYLEAYKHGEKK